MILIPLVGKVGGGESGFLNRTMLHGDDDSGIF
jgi:hypothetical protein